MKVHKNISQTVMFGDCRKVFDLLVRSTDFTKSSFMERFSISDDSEVSLLETLDQARKAHDLVLSKTDFIGEEISASDLNTWRQERFLLNSLRKWRLPVRNSKGEIQFSSGARAATAVEGFLNRNDENTGLRIAKWLRDDMRDIIHHALRGFNEVFEKSTPKFGPGAVKEGYPLIRRWCEVGRDPHLTNGWLDLRASIDLDVACEDTACRLHAVPKVWNKDRLITVETMSQTFIQHKCRQALGRTLCNNGLRHLVNADISGIDMQPVHREWAKTSSIQDRSETGRVATLDLTNASDCITWADVVDLFPVEVVAELERGRSTMVNGWIYDPISHKVAGSFGEPLNIYAGMGNSTTFVVETLLFWALIRATLRYFGAFPQTCLLDANDAWTSQTGLSRFEDICSVYGDDCVIPDNNEEENMANLVAFAFRESGFEVNETKSFASHYLPVKTGVGSRTKCQNLHSWGSCVRESCGVWAFAGHDFSVIPFYGYELYRADRPKARKTTAKKSSVNKANAGHMLGLQSYVMRTTPVAQHLLLQEAPLKTWPNMPTWVPNTISVCDPSRDVNLERIQWDKCLHVLKARLLAPKGQFEILHGQVPLGAVYGALLSQVKTKKVGPKHSPAKDTVVKIPKPYRTTLSHQEITLPHPGQNGNFVWDVRLQDYVDIASQPFLTEGMRE